MSRSSLSRSRSLYYLFSGHLQRASSSPSLHPISAPLSPPQHALSEPSPASLLPSSSSNHTPRSRSLVSTTSSNPTRETVSSLAKEIIASSANEGSPDLASVASLLDSHSAKPILRLSCNGDCSPFLLLLTLLKPRPLLALQVFYWRRSLPDSPPLTADEYASAIALAGRAHNLSLAVKLFYESISTFSDPALYNALMFAFAYTGDFTSTLCVFNKLKKETKQGPDNVSYNVLLSFYSFRTLVNQMESVLKNMDSSGIPRMVDTYNILMSGYLRSKRWDKMEEIFGSLEEPDTSTRLLMLRGYAIGGQLNKMEKMYNLVKEDVLSKQRSLIWVMICAYSKVRGHSSLAKMKELLQLVRPEEYFPYLHILLLKVCAVEGSIDEMERLIIDAYKRNIAISSVDIMRKILGVYFKCGDVDRLDYFIKLAEKAGWRLCKDLYRCKMVLYSRLGRLREMSCEVDKMDSYWPARDRRTLRILYIGFCNAGKSLEMNMVIGLMFKHGFQFPRGVVVQ